MPRASPRGPISIGIHKRVVAVEASCASSFDFNWDAGCSVTRRGANWLIGDGFFRVEKELAERALPKNEIKDSIYVPQTDESPPKLG